MLTSVNSTPGLKFYYLLLIKVILKNNYDFYIGCGGLNH